MARADEKKRAKTRPNKPTKKAATVAAYLALLPPERRAAIDAVRTAINRRLPAGYQEGIHYGMISWCVPHSIYPQGYHCDPSQGLPFAGLASQKQYMSLYLMSVYGHEATRKKFEAAYAKTGKRLDMGKCCVRFRKAEDLPLDLIGDTVAVPVKEYVARYESLVERGPRGAKRWNRDKV